MPTTDYLVRFGRPGFVGRFRDLIGRDFARGVAVAVRTPRGREVGEVLALATSIDVGPAGELDGSPVDSPSPDREAEILAAAQCVLAAAPVAVLDCELLLDPVAVLHVAAWDACDLTPILDELSIRFGLDVRVHHLGAEPKA